MKTTGKRLISLALCLVMVLALVPAKVYAEQRYDVWIDGMQFTDSKLTFTYGGGSASFDPSTSTLTINNITADTCFGNDWGVIHSEIPLTVNVIGNCTLAPMERFLGAYGIWVEGDLVLTGPGNLDIKVLPSGNSAIYAKGGNLTVDMDGNLTAYGNNGLASANTVALLGSGDVDLHASDYGIKSSRDVSLSGDGNVSIHSYYYGIRSGKDVTFSGSGDVKVYGSWQGITAKEGVTLSGSSNLTVTSEHIGALIEKGDVVLSGSGNVDICGVNDGIRFLDGDSAVLLNGIHNSVKFGADGNRKAVNNEYSDKSPVAGVNFGKYRVTGDPASTFVEYTMYDPIADVSITGLDQPKVGLRPDTTCTVTNPLGYQLSASVKWLEYENGTPKVMSASDVFKEGLQYTCRITVDTTEYHPFKYTVKFNSHNVPYTVYGGTLTVNGEKQDCTMSDDLLQLGINWWGKEPLPRVPFVDVKTKDYFYEPVVWAVEAGITQGTDATHFSPKDTCTRAQVVTFLWRAAGCPEPVATKNPFEDVKEKDYFYKAVLWAVEKGITQGTDTTHFSPKNSCTRAQVVTFMYRSYGSPAVSRPCPFVDVKEKDYFYNAVLWAIGCDITQGTDATHFSPNSPCTRAQIVTFLWRDETR